MSFIMNLVFYKSIMAAFSLQKLLSDERPTILLCFYSNVSIFFSYHSCLKTHTRYITLINLYIFWYAPCFLIYNEAALTLDFFELLLFIGLFFFLFKDIKVNLGVM
ncbi:hypothetical protein ACJX0J_009222 [Zea mays]